jgi:hypothetical protein
MILPLWHVRIPGSTEGNVRVEEVVRIRIEPTVDQQKAFEKDAIELIKRLLTQEGHSFKDVSNGEGSKPVSDLRSIWMHIVYDRSDPGLVCVWIRVPL